MPAAALFDLRITHPFYTDTRCGDLSIAATPDTDALMRRLKLTPKIFADHVSVYAGLTGRGTAVAAAAAPVSLGFVLRLNRGEFPLITDLSSLSAQIAPLFTNAGVATADTMNLRLTTRTASTTQTLVSVASSAAETFALPASALPGAVPAEVSVSGAGAVKAVSPDGRAVTIDTSGIAKGASFQITYPVRPTRPPETLAEVALTLDAGLLTPAALPRGFIIPFAADASFWAYYVVMNFGGDISTLRIVDATPGNAPRAISFADNRRTDLSQTPDTGDAAGQDLLRRNPGRRVIRFLSDAAVPAREIPLSQLELHLGDVKLAGNLSNPQPGHFVALRNVPAPASNGPVLYQVLTLLSN